MADRDLTRREIMRAAALLGLTGLAACDDDEPAAPVGKRVIVVGAGISGVVCARALQRQGFEVVVLEARSRLGGRIWTDRRFGFPIELGANWIEGGGRGNPLTPIARANGLRLVEADDDFLSFDHDGRRLGDDEVDEIDEGFVELTETAERLAEDRERDLSLEAAYRAALRGESPTTFERRGLEYALAAIETDTAGALDQVSAWYGLDDASFGGEDYLLPGGYDQVVRALARDLEILRDEAVREVSISGGRVAVTAGSRLEADAVVVTVPLGALKANAVSFSPALPAAKRAAIRRLRMGTLNKVVLRFERAFWPDAQQFAYWSRTRGEFPEILNWAAITGHPVLKAFTGGAYAVAMERRPDAQVVRDAMAVLRRCFGADVPEPTGHVISRWASDPLTHGSYSFIPVGSDHEDRDALAAPVADTLFFAGEATHRSYPATVHGAFLSGVRAAEEVVEAHG